MQKLKIAQISPIIERVPPKKYGGIERIVSILTDELVSRGHDVTLFATGDSDTKAKLVSVYPRSLREARLKSPGRQNEWIFIHLGKAYKQYEKFDIIHDHNSVYGPAVAHFVETPTVITLHGSVSPAGRRLYETFDNPNYVAISKAQVAHFPTIKIASVIHNGLDLSKYPYSGKSKGYLLFVGRICMDKGTHIAIDVAEELNLPLIIAGKLDAEDISYYKEYIESRLYSDRITWVGEVDTEKRNELMSNAICLINPITWKEPFGLTMIEAMACGCPVVAFDNGSIPEIVQNNKTGFVVSDIDEMIESVNNIEKIKRIDCKRYALNNFSSKLMVNKYEDLYTKLLNSKK